MTTGIDKREADLAGMTVTQINEIAADIGLTFAKSVKKADRVKAVVAKELELFGQPDETPEGTYDVPADEEHDESVEPEIEGTVTVVPEEQLDEVIENIASREETETPLTPEEAEKAVEKADEADGTTVEGLLARLEQQRAAKDKAGQKKTRAALRRRGFYLSQLTSPDTTTPTEERAVELVADGWTEDDAESQANVEMDEEHPEDAD